MSRERNVRRGKVGSMSIVYWFGFGFILSYENTKFCNFEKVAKVAKVAKVQKLQAALTKIWFQTIETPIICLKDFKKIPSLLFYSVILTSSTMLICHTFLSPRCGARVLENSNLSGEELIKLRLAYTQKHQIVHFKASRHTLRRLLVLSQRFEFRLAFWY